jgi:hypothetical protein
MKKVESERIRISSYGMWLLDFASLSSFLLVGSVTRVHRNNVKNKKNNVRFEDYFSSETLVNVCQTTRLHFLEDKLTSLPPWEQVTFIYECNCSSPVGRREFIVFELNIS